jgi:hypothetical protein
VSNILRWFVGLQKLPINTSLRAQTSELRRTGHDPEFLLSGRFSRRSKV